MNTSVSQSTSPLFPAPLAADPDDTTIPDMIRDGHASYSVKRVHGRCSRFCANDDVPTTDATLAEHGPMCRSQSGLVAPGLRGADGRPGGVYGNLVAPYLHGVYNASDEYPEWWGYVELSIDFPTAGGGWAEGELYMTAAQARTIAAGLTYLADELERPDEPLRNERARREAEARTEGQA